MKKEPVGIFSRLKNLIMPDAPVSSAEQVTNNRILGELLACFSDSLEKETVGTSLLFNTHFIIILHPDTYEARLTSLPVIVKEAVKAFYHKLNDRKPQYEEVTPVSSNWHFKFGPATTFNQEVIDPGDIRVIGMLTGQKEIAAEVRTKVTMKPKQSNVYDKLDINLDALRHIDFRESGTFAVKFNSSLQMKGDTQTRSMGSSLARIDYYIADKNQEGTYQIRDKEIVIARKESENTPYNNYLLIDSAFVSNPHARIRYNDATSGFQIANFSRNETRVNERLIPKSEPSNPQWFDLQHKSQILLNRMVTLTFQTN